MTSDLRDALLRAGTVARRDCAGAPPLFDASDLELLDALAAQASAADRAAARELLT